jgi:hemolysin activation/secretion protein
VSYPILLSFTRALSVGLGFDGLNSDNAFLGENVSSDRTRALRLSASYVRLVDESRLTAALSISQGIDSLGARTSVPALTDLSFLKLNAQAEYDRPIVKSLVIRLGASGQITDDKLPSSEQASIGGEAFGRAFDAAIAAGDKNIAGSAELAYLISDVPTPLSTPEVYVFADAGHVWRAARGGFDGSDTGLASAGIGARVKLFSNVALGLEFARALDNPDTDPGDKDWRAIFSFSTSVGR